MKQGRRPTRRKQIRQTRKKLYPLQPPPPSGETATKAPAGPFHTDTSLGATKLAWQQQEDRGDVARDTADQKNKNIAAVAPPVELSAAPITAPAPTLEAVPRFSVTEASPQPTLYPADPGGTVIVQNQITINIHSTDFLAKEPTRRHLWH